MSSRHSQVKIGLAILSIALAVSGCTIPGSVTGGGWIPSADGVSGDKANFGFSAAQCDLNQPATGTFNYHDKTSKFSAPGSVKLNGTIADAGQCVSLPCNTDADCTAAPNGSCTGNPGICLYPGVTAPTQGCLLCAEAASFGLPLPTKTYGMDVNYTSTNTSYPGNGTATVCAVDNGQGSKASSKDFIILTVNSGPYDGYQNQGLVQGNIAAQTCP